MEHTFKAIDEELKGLNADVAAMGAFAVAQVKAAVDAFARHDAAAAAAITAADARLDAYDTDIERRAVRFIALRQPMAEDLRRPIAAMKTAMQLERCGDLAKNIAKRISRLAAPPAETPLQAISDLGGLVAERLAAVVAAYEADDAEAAVEVWSRDTEIDERHERVMREVMIAMSADPAAIGAGAQLLFIAKNLERIGDHATNIAELVHYQVTGTELEDRPKL